MAVSELRLNSIYNSNQIWHFFKSLLCRTLGSSDSCKVQIDKKTLWRCSTHNSGQILCVIAKTTHSKTSNKSHKDRLEKCHYDDLMKDWVRTKFGIWTYTPILYKISSNCPYRSLSCNSCHRDYIGKEALWCRATSISDQILYLTMN